MISLIIICTIQCDPSTLTLVCPVLTKDPEMEVDTLLCKISALVSLLSSLENEVCLCGVQLLLIIDQAYLLTFMRGKSVMKFMS